MELAARTIVESRLKAGGYLAGCVGFVAAGFWMALSPDRPGDVVWGWACVAFFSLGVPTFAWLLVRPMRLTLDASGFVLAGGFRRLPKRFGWSDIDRFFVYRGPRGEKMIRFSYAPGYAPPGRVTWLARAIAGGEAGLPSGWTLSPEQLVDVLNDYRSRYGSAAVPAQPQIVS